jgi:hypothetical protein
MPCISSILGYLDCWRIFSCVGWIDAVPTQHLPCQYVGLRKDATQPTRLHFQIINTALYSVRKAENRRALEQTATHAQRHDPSAEVAQGFVCR